MNLFVADNFSESEIKYSEVIVPPIFLIEVLSKYFGKFNLVTVFKLNRPEINSENYKIILETVKGKNIFLLRKNKVLKNKEQINFYLELICFLSKNGVKVSRIVRNNKSELSTVLGEDIYTLFYFIEGEYFKPTERLLKSVACNVSLMHFGFNSLPPESIFKINKLSGDSQTYFNVIKRYSFQDFEEIRDIIKKKKDISKVDNLFLENLTLIKNDVISVKTKEEKINQIPKKVIHSDLHPHNMLVQGEEVRAIVDFDGVRLSQQSRDVACAIYRFGRQFFVNNSVNVKEGAVHLKDLFLEEYEERKVLSKEEKELMPTLVKDEFLTKLLFVLKGIYKENNLTWAKDLSKFLVALQEIKYFWPD